MACDSERPEFPSQNRGTSDSNTNNESRSGEETGDAGDTSVGSTQGSSASKVTDESNASGDSADTDPTNNGSCEVGRKRPCAANGAEGNCAAGEQECGQDGKWGSCSITPGDNDDCSKPGDDADCDGTPNSGCECTDGQEQSCGPEKAVGRCKPGKSVCAGGAYEPCEGAVEATARDCASSEDHDCDGKPDNTIDGQCTCEPGMTRPCEEHEGLDGYGQCTAGEQVCEASGDGTTSEWGDCVGSVGPALQDSCDGEDDSNCNGVFNEGCSCTGNAECNDNAACTTDVCQDGSCVYTVQAAFCRIDGQCIAHNAKDPNNPCRYCDAKLNQTAWTNTPAGAACDDGIWCNGTDSCNGSGQCAQHQFATHRCAAGQNCDEQRDECVSLPRLGETCGGECSVGLCFLGRCCETQCSTGNACDTQGRCDECFSHELVNGLGVMDCEPGSDFEYCLPAGGGLKERARAACETCLGGPCVQVLCENGGGYTRAVDGVNNVWMFEVGCAKPGEVWSNITGQVNHSF